MFVFFGTVSRSMLISDVGEVSESLFFFVFFEAVSRKMPTSWPMSFGIVVFLGLSREICSSRGEWAFF